MDATKSDTDNPDRVMFIGTVLPILTPMLMTECLREFRGEDAVNEQDGQTILLMKGDRDLVEFTGRATRILARFLGLFYDFASVSPKMAIFMIPIMAYIRAQQPKGKKT